MQNYGKINPDGSISLSFEQLEGFKPVRYTDMPEFDQTTHFVEQGEVSEFDEFIQVQLELIPLNTEDAAVEQDDHNEVVEYPPWEDIAPDGEVEQLKKEIKSLQNALDFVIMNY